MTQVSRFRLTPEVWDRVFDLYLDTLISIKNKEDLINFLEDFLSPTEKIVFAKRLAIAVLLEKGNDYREISQILRVTPVTISKMSTLLKYKSKGLIPVIRAVVNKDKTKATWERLLGLLDLPKKGSTLAEWHLRKSRRKKKIRDLVTGI